MTGGGYDGSEWGTKPYTNMFSLAPDDPKYPVNDGGALFIKDQGGDVTSAFGYGQSLLDDSSAVTAADGGYFISEAAPVELNTPATKSFAAALAKYAHFTGIPGFDYQEGWMAADRMIKGLEVAGQTRPRASFESGLHGVTNYDAGGLLAPPVSFSLSQFGLLPQTQCTYYL